MATTPRFISERRRYWASFVIFAAQGVMSTAFWTRSPQIATLLHLSVASMGFLGLVSSTGGLLGLFISGRLAPRFGNRHVMLPAYVVVMMSVLVIAFAAVAGSVPVVACSLFVMGLASGVAGLANNLEGASIDRASSRSLLPSLHGAFSAGTLAGSGLGALLITLRISLPWSFAIMCALYVILLATGIFNIPRHSGRLVTSDMNTAAIAQLPSAAERAAVKRDARLWGVAFIVFGMTLAETVASTWIPLALVSDLHVLPASASFGLTLFFAGMTIGRFSGGKVVDALGRSRALLVFAVTCALGIVVVQSSVFTHLPYLGTFLWGVGCSVGFPLCLASVSFDQRLASTRVSYIAVTGSTSATAGPPVVGLLAQASSLFAAFTVPVVFLIAGLFANNYTRLTPQEVAHHETLLDLP